MKEGSEGSKRTGLLSVILVTIIGSIILLAITIPALSAGLSFKEQHVTPFPTFQTWYPPALQTLDMGEWQTQAAARLTPTITGTHWSFGGVSFDTPVPPGLTWTGTPAGDGIIIDDCSWDTGISAMDKALGIWYRNSWYAKINDQQIDIFAGSYISDSAQGAILVLINGDEHFFLSPYPGAVCIIAASGPRLILHSERGQTFYFDVPTLQFTSSLYGILPTFTPLPPGPSLTLTLNGDAPHRIADVYNLSPVNIPLHFAIRHPGELEWFAFRVSIPGTIRVHLSNLSVNYDLYVYNTRHSGYDGQSTNLGTTSETVIITNAPVDDYMVQVASVDGAFDLDHLYQLKFDVSYTPTSTLTLTPSVTITRIP